MSEMSVRYTSTEALLGQIELVAEQLDEARHKLWDLIAQQRAMQVPQQQPVSTETSDDH